MKYLGLIFLGLVLIPASAFAAPAKQATTSAIIRATATTEWQFDRTHKEFPHVGSETWEDVTAADDETLVIYPVRNKTFTKGLSGGEVKWTEESRKTVVDYRIWDIFIKIAGDKQVKGEMGAYLTYRIPEQSTLAFTGRAVRGEAKNPWFLAVNTNGADFNNPKWERDIVITLLHEYGHFLTLNSYQMDNDLLEISCKKKDRWYENSYFGCAKAKSYYAQFIAKFWNTKGLWDAQKSIKNKDDAFYRANKSSFVTEYAASSPAEDIAESFVEFILRTKPAGLTKKEQKILFFYEFPELVKERTRIRNEIVGHLYL